MKKFGKRLSEVWIGWVIAVAVLLAYSDSFGGPFHFDDPSSIAGNPSIRQLSTALHPPEFRTVTGRPIANLSLAINYAIGGEEPLGYHIGNCLFHLLAGLTLFGVMRRTLQHGKLAVHFASDALPLAAAIALIWSLHPLLTESVTYVIQRVESLMGLFYLVTIYCFIRGTEPSAPRIWFGLSVIACLLGMGTKEVMVSAPLLVLLYDRILVAGSFRQAWSRRWGLYVGLAATWLWLAVLVLQAQGRNGTAGLDAGISSWTYLLTQCRAIMHYLRLSVWPDPLVFDYGLQWVASPREVVAQGLALLALLGATIWALRFRPVLALLGCWFFAILAPSSSIVPVVTQSMAEHRMYLPLAAVVVLVVLTSYRYGGARSLLLWPVAVCVLGWLTFRRNLDYRDTMELWRDTIAKCPANPRAHDALGTALSDAHRLPEAMAEFRRALAIDPSYVESHNNLGAMLGQAHQIDAAIAEFRSAISLKPGFTAARYNLADMLAEKGQLDEALRHYLEVLQVRPDDADVLERVADLEMKAGDAFAAVDHYRAELTIRPTAANVRFNLAFTLAGQGRASEAQAVLREGIALDPNYAMGHYNLGNALIGSNLLAEAAEEYKRATELDPTLVAAHYNLGNTLALMKRYPEAIQAYEAALKIDPNHAQARQNLEEARRQLGFANQSGPPAR